MSFSATAWSAIKALKPSRPRAGQEGPLRIVEGLDLPIDGAPEQVVSDSPRPHSVALLGSDTIGLRPALAVEEGQRVRAGQALYSHKKQPRVLFTSPGCGIVRAINRGPRRALISLVIDLDGTDEERFTAWEPAQIATLRSDQIIENLCNAGLWPALRTRPFGRIADPAGAPTSIFVTATDGNPLAANPGVVIAASRAHFLNGLQVLARLADTPVYCCHGPDLRLTDELPGNVITQAFSGPHPSGLVGTHIHFLDPVGPGRTVWHIGYQDVIAIGALFTTGRPAVERIIALAGPQVRHPRLIRTLLGADIETLTRGELDEGPARVISGSLLSGRQALGPLAYLGRYHNQISVIAEAGPADQNAGLMPGRGTAFSAYRLPRPRGARRPTYALSSALHGAPGPLYPLGGFERVMPLDVLATPLLRALLVGDLEMAQDLGCLELDEEDLALCSFVCPGKNDYGRLLRVCLEAIERGD